MENKIVAHLRGGTVFKGITRDFDPDHEHFHLLPAEGGGVPVRLAISDLKALFYVKDYLGNRDFVAQRAFAESRRAGRKAIVTFNDGEEIWGYLAEDADEDQAGFFFYPADEADNNLQIYVIRSAMEGLRLVS